MDIPRPGPPFAFLLNLAAKHFDTFPAASMDKSADDVLGATEAYAQCHDLAPSTNWEFTLRTHRNLLSLLQELAAFDTFHQIPQFRLRDASAVLGGLFSRMDPGRAEGALGASPDTIAALVAEVDSLLGESIGPASFSASDFSSLGGRERTTRLLTTFSHTAPVNARYLRPLETSLLTAGTRPLFSSGDMFTVLDGRVAGHAFVERSLALM